MIEAMIGVLIALVVAIYINWLVWKQLKAECEEFLRQYREQYRLNEKEKSTKTGVNGTIPLKRIEIIEKIIRKLFTGKYDECDIGNLTDDKVDEEFEIAKVNKPEEESE